MTFVLFVVGLGLLVAGAELLVRGASRLAAAVGISPLVVGLTVVAFGTSAPEFAVSAQSAFAGQADIALGNVVGSNIFNVLFILGISALIIPLAVDAQLVRFDVPLMIGASLIAFLFGLDGAISRLEGVALFAGIIAYTVFLVTESRRESQAVKDEYASEFADEEERKHPHWGLDVALIVAGLAMLGLGSRWLVDGALEFARAFGVSELVIGLTIVAAGTSLPELAASTVAAVRGERDIAVGNVVGSNIFNLLGVLGFAGILSPAGVDVADSARTLDLPVMIAVALACLPIFFTGQIARWGGGMFIGYYVAYTAYLLLAASNSPAQPAFTAIMTTAVMPVTVLALLVVAVKHVRQRDRGALTSNQSAA